MFGKLGAPEILLILVVLVLLFGAKRLPAMARSLGQSLRIIKSETKAMRNDDEATITSASAPIPEANVGDPLATVSGLNRQEASTAATSGTYSPH
ncbi:Sec-independent protein translocase subunit TatA [Streptomyces sp. NBC_00687]|uniref:Sec-independent protein translocase subunit TatA n=1 Tax=Streptomyces sp. NBC_00687 TaxID=2975807 RepID=UPI002258B5FF|nr:Sec-independent protein translocase subunit TatA [Streptomyces sp. NBC_00687]MCX4912033.1 Sec-independent protein translocase subunit TatA [Streptomyces sp. NBC_00687]